MQTIIQTTFFQRLEKVEGIVYNKNTSHSPCKYKSQPLEDAAMATGRGYEKGDGKTKKGSVQQQLPLPSTQSTASSSSSEPMQTQQQQVASTPPNSITTGSQNVSLNSTLFLGTNHSGPAPSNWFISTIPEDAPAARPAEPVAVFTDDDLFDEPDCPDLPLSVVCAVVDGVVVLKRRGWQKTVVGGKM